MIFEKEQLQKLRVMYNPGLTLLGFKPKSALKVYHNLKHSSFLYPDEHFIQGSTVVFAALLDRMLALEKVSLFFSSPPFKMTQLPASDRHLPHHCPFECIAPFVRPLAPGGPQRRRRISPSTGGYTSPSLLPHLLSHLLASLALIIPPQVSGSSSSLLLMIFVPLKSPNSQRLRRNRLDWLTK